MNYPLHDVGDSQQQPRQEEDDRPQGPEPGVEEHTALQGFPDAPSLGGVRRERRCTPGEFQEDQVDLAGLYLWR